MRVFAHAFDEETTSVLHTLRLVPKELGPFRDPT